MWQHVSYNTSELATFAFELFQFQPLLLVARTVEFYGVTIRIVTANARTTLKVCDGTVPLSVITQLVGKTMGVDSCRPFCQNLIPCQTMRISPRDDDLEEHVFKCSCFRMTCNDLAFHLPTGAIVDGKRPLKICQLQAHYQLYP